MEYTLTYNHQSQFIEMFGNPFDECSDKVSLSSLCIINPSRPKDLDDSLPVSFIPMDSISEEGEYSTFTSRPLGEVKKGFTYCADEDVLFAKITPCMENGKGAMLKELSNGIGFGSTEFHVLRPLPGVTTSTWLYNLTKLDILRKDAAKNMTGTGGQKRVPASYLETFSVLPPSIELQEEFAAISQQADKSKFDGFKSQFIEMFGNPLFSDEDDAIELREVTEIVLGSTPNSKNERYWNGNLCWITPSELSDDSFEVANTERHISEDGAKSANLTLMPKGTVLLSTRAPIGKVALTTCPMYCNQGFKNMICTDGINNVFLYYTLKYNKNRLQSMGTGTTFKELSKKIIESIKISVPPIQAQKEFESIYRQADKSKYYVQNKLNYICHILTKQIQLKRCS